MVFGRGVHLHGHVDEAEGQGAFPDRSHGISEHRKGGGCRGGCARSRAQLLQIRPSGPLPRAIRRDLQELCRPLRCTVQEIRPSHRPSVPRRRPSAACLLRCVRDRTTPPRPPQPPRHPPPPPLYAGAMTEQTVRIGGRRLRLSNLDKVLYPETGTTKGEVIDYYTRIAPLLLPHVADRPLTRKRWPDGVGTDADPGEPFFAKALEPGAPAWVRRFPIDHSSGAKDYPLVDDLPTLVYLAQVASLELHVPQWRFAPTASGRTPTGWCSIWIRARASVSQNALRSPVGARDPAGHRPRAVPGDQRQQGHPSVRAPRRPPVERCGERGAKELARAIEADHPDLVVSQMSKAARPGKVFIDWSQNNGSKTTIAPYSLRGRPRPFVAAPRTWGARRPRPATPVVQRGARASRRSVGSG